MDYNRCREKKNAWIQNLQERVEFFDTKKLHEIEQTMLELKYLRAIVAEHFKVCPSPRAELVACFKN
jgi:hypothetical protein